jgi:Lipocalin-like domain
MNRRSVVTISAMSALGLLMLVGESSAQQKTLKEQLVGAWTLVSNETTTPDGTKQQTFGANPKGVLILEAGGQYALVFGTPGRPKFKDTSNLRTAATPEEWAVAARGFAANFGTWSVDEANKTLIRKYELALIPNNDGIETKAAVSLTGDELKLTITPAAGGKNETVYRRAK